LTNQNGEYAKMPDVYLLHFDRPYWARARHYIGYTKFTAEERITKHRAGNGSKLVAYALAHGANFEVAQVEHFDTIPEAREREKNLKARHGARKLCSVCKGVSHVS
jgi:predicted GIY-YIG superfamily endonuclease